MTLSNKSDPATLQKLRKKVKQEKQATDNQTPSTILTNNKTTNRTNYGSAPSFSNKSDPDALKRLQRRVNEGKAERAKTTTSLSDAKNTPNRTLSGNTQAAADNQLYKDLVAFNKYAVDKKTDIDGTNKNTTLPKAEFMPAPQKSFWEKIVDSVDAFLDENLPSGSNAAKMYDKAKGYTNKGSWTEDQLAQIAVNALNNTDSVDSRNYAMVNEAYERLSTSDKYKDSDLVSALREAKKSWQASPGTALGKNTLAAAAGMGADVASFANSLGADKIPGVGQIMEAAVKGGQAARAEAARYNKGGYGETVGNFTQGVVNLIPYFFLGAGKGATDAALKATKYSKYIAPIVKNPSFWYSLTTMWGGKYQEAIDNGASRQKALANAVTYAVPAALVEVGGGIGSPEMETQKLSRTMLEEIGEELAQDIISGISDKATTNPQLPIYSMEDDAIINPVNMAKTALMTAPIVAVAGGVNRAVNRAAGAYRRNVGNNTEIISDDTQSKVQSNAQSDTQTETKSNVQPMSNISDTNDSLNTLKTKKHTRTKGLTLAENLEEQSKANEPLSVEDVKKATGFGDEGSKLVTNLANMEGVTFSQAERTVKTAYLAGFANVEGTKVNFETDTQINAFTAGKKDRAMQDLSAKENAQNATVYDGAFTENKYTKNWSNATKKMVSTVAKHFGMDIKAVDRIIANEYTGAEANASHADGKMRISSVADPKKLIHALVLHESGHRMEQFATAEWNELANFLYQRAERLGRRVELGITQDMEFDAVKAEHDNAGISMPTKDYIGEIAVRELETIFSSAEEFNSFIAEIDSNQQVKSAWGKFVEWLSELIEDLKTAWSQRKMTAEEKAEARKAIAELEHINELYAKAYLATKDAVQERANIQTSDTNSANNLAINANKNYNGNASYSMKSKYNEYNSFGMKWAYSSSTKIGDRNVLYKPRIKKYVLVEATKEDVGFIELKTGTYKQLREDEKLYESNKQREFADNERDIDTAIHNFESGQNHNTRSNVDVGNRGTGIQNAEVSERKSESNKTADTQTDNGNLNDSIRLSLSKNSDGRTLTESQQEYFKDSKVRDENGNLLVMYHGTPNATFTQFRPGTYFTEHKWYADRYQGQGASSLSYKKTADNPDTYVGYLNIKKPFDTRNKAERDIFYNEYYRQYGTGTDLMESGLPDWLDGGDLQEFLEEKGYDYDGLILDEGAVGGYGEEVVSRGLAYVIFKPEQFKNIDNLNPTSDPDIRFSLAQPVEETKNLIAVHNLSPAKLLKTLRLGGLPMPSIAITRAKDGYNNFGDISLVFNKDTIDPQFMRSNKVYSGDAWTPTYPQVAYKVNEKAQEQIRKKINGLVPKNIQDDLGGLHLDAYNMEDDLNRHGDMSISYRYNYAMKYAFLKDNNVSIELPTKEEPFYRYGEVSNDAVASFAHKLVDGLKTANSLLEQHSSKLMEDTELLNSIATVLNEEVMATTDKNSVDYQKLAENPLFKPEEIDLSTVLGMLEAARKYFHSNGKVESRVDYQNAKGKIDDYFDAHSLEPEYEYWLKKLFSDIVAKEGIRNNRDLFTPSGNRRSFEALHYEHNLENVIKAMKEQGDTGVGAFGGGNILGAATREYGSIADIKADAQNRMEQLPESQHDEIRKGFTDRLFELAYSLPIHKDRFSAVDNAANMLIEAVSKYKTKSGMANYLRKESQGWANYNDYIVDDLIELVNDIRQMPVSYFEAKPQRAVGFDEIKAVIMPEQSSYEDDLSELKVELEKINIPILEYEYGDNNSRIKALNSLENVKFSLKGTRDINSKDRQALLDIIEHLKGEFEITKFPKSDPKKLAKMTKAILKEYNSKADYDETFKAVDELYQYMANGEDGYPAVWEEIYNKAYNVAQEIAKSALITDDYMYQEYKSLRDYLRTTPMKFISGYDSVPSSYENFNDFRKRNMGRLKFTKDGMTIDEVYQELSSLYPEFFDAEKQTNSSDQLATIVDVLDSIRAIEVNPFDGQIKQVSMQLANDLTSRFFDIPQAKPTFADKAERRVVEAYIKGGKRVEAVRQQKDAKIQKLMKDQKEKTKKQLDKLREQRDAKVKKEQEKRRAAISKMSEKQKAKVLRAQIIRHTSDLSKKLVSPTDNQHIPQELQGAVATLLECINLESNYTYDIESRSYKKNDEGLPTRRTRAFNELKKVYSDIASSVVVDPDLIGDNGLLSDVISLADKRIADMTSSELETVWQTIRAIEASVSTANKIFSQGRFETILEFAEALRKDNAGKKEKTEFRGLLGRVKKLTMLDMLTPETYFHYIGSAGDSIFRMMRDAQDKHISIMKEVSDFTRKTLKDVDVNSLENTIHTVKLGGEDVQLSTAQLMELYVLMKRGQAIDHILVGGILPDVTKGKAGKLNTKAEPIRGLSVEEISTAISKLTDEQKRIADKLQRYVSSVLSDYGNEASMKVYNYEKFLEKNYWPIRTNKQEIVSEIGKDTAVTSVANKGMAKGTKPHANTSVRIGSIFDTFSAHSSDMATYAAWLGTSEDVNRIRNFVFKENGVRTGTVKGILDTVHGLQGSQYLEKLLTDIAIGVNGTDNMNPFDEFVGGYKAASVGANLRVVIQQPTAILRALDMINARYLAEGAMRPLKGWEKAKRYAPIAQWKDWGYFDINTGRQMKDVLFDNASRLEKTKQAGMWAASMADSIAWGQLWNAVEAETRDNYKELEVGSDAYYETVAKRFTEIVDHTQVVDGILQRSQIMRSSGALTKMATSFMGEPTKQYNMAAAAAYDAKNLKGDAKKKAVARLGRTAVSLAVAGIVNACAQSIIDAMRDDGKEKDYWEKWLAAFKGDGEETRLINSNLGDTFNPLGYVPFAKDIMSIMQGYDVKRMDVEAISKTLNAVTNMYKAVTGTGKYTIAEASAQLFAEIGRLVGLPVANVKRDIKSLVMSVAIETDNYLMQYRMEKTMLDINYAGNSKNFVDILFNAHNNDREAYELIYNDMLESGYDAKKIQSGMEDRMKKAEGVENVSELTKRYMTPDNEKKYDSSLNKVKASNVWKTANATQRKNAEAALYEFLTSNTEDAIKTRTEAGKFDVDATEYALYQLAIEMADQPKGQKGSGNYTYTEKAEAINSLNLDDKEIAYFFEKGLNESGKEELNEVLSKGIDVKEYVNFKAAVSEMEADKNAKGNSIPNSKKRKVVNYLNNANLTYDEWAYFYYEVMNYKK